MEKMSGNLSLRTHVLSSVNELFGLYKYLHTFVVAESVLLIFKFGNFIYILKMFTEAVVHNGVYF